MADINNFITQIFTPKGFSGFIQFLIIVVEIVYVLFAFMLTRQLKIMNHNFQTSQAPIFTILANLHFIAAVVIVIFSILAI